MQQARESERCSLGAHDGSISTSGCGRAVEGRCWEKAWWRATKAGSRARAVERKDGGRASAVERAMVEHTAAVRVRRRGRDAACRDGTITVRGCGGMGGAAARKPKERESERGASRIFFSNVVRVYWASVAAHQQ
jgi:hypothetical protein